MMKPYNKLHFLGSLALALLLNACAGMSKTPEQLVEQRAQERWELLVEGDLVSAYEYLSPGYRSSVSLMAYQKKVFSQPVQWKNATYTGSDCSEDVCNVKFSVKFTVAGGVPGVRQFESRDVIEENWIRDGNNWYFVPK